VVESLGIAVIIASPEKNEKKLTSLYQQSLKVVLAICDIKKAKGEVS